MSGTLQRCGLDKFSGDISLQAAFEQENKLKCVILMLGCQRSVMQKALIFTNVEPCHNYICVISTHDWFGQVRHDCAVCSISHDSTCLKTVDGCNRLFSLGYWFLHGDHLTVVLDSSTKKHTNSVFSGSSFLTCRSLEVSLTLSTSSNHSLLPRPNCFI